MCFIGGGGNIAIASNCPIPIVFCVWYYKHQIVYGIFLSYFFCFFVYLKLPILDVETNPCPRCPVPAVAMCRAWPGALVTWPWLRLRITYCSALRFWSQICVTCRSCWFCCPVLFYRSKMPWARGMAAYVRDYYGVFRQPKFECGCCQMLVFKVCDVRQNHYVFGIYHNPYLDDRILDCLLTSMAASSSLPPLVSQGVVDCCVSRFLRLICCRIILTASSPGRLLIYRSLTIRLLVLPPLLSGRVMSGVSC